MPKKAQITVFIIVGMVVLIAFAGVFMLVQNGPAVNAPDTEMIQITGFVTNCIVQVAEPGAKIIGMQGGHIVLPNDYVSAAQINMGYGYYLGNNTLASKKQMEIELGAYVDSGLLQCIDNFSTFNGRNISFGKPSTSATILDNKILLTTDFPVESGIRKQKSFSSEVPITLGRTYNIAGQVISEIKADPDWIDLSYLSMFDGVKVNIVPQGVDTMLYFLLDDKGYLFAFASKVLLNKAPVIDMPSEIEIKDGMPWLYKVNCTDPDKEELIVEDNTAMIDTLIDGSILSVVEIQGEYNVTFRCSDEHYNRDEKTVLIRVVE